MEALGRAQGGCALNALGLRQVIDALEARDLEAGARPVRDALLPNGYALLEVATLGDASEGRGRHAGQAAWLRSLAATSTPWALELHHDGARSTCRLALPEHHAEAGMRLFAAAFPGGRAVPALGAAIHPLASLPERAVLAGNPDLSGVESNAPRLDFLLRALSGMPWGYVVFAQPLPPDAVAGEVATLRRAEQEITAAFLRPGTSEAVNHPLASHALELVQEARIRREAGQQSGMWSVQGFFCAENRAGLRRAAQAVAGAFAGPGARPQPFRTILCGAASDHAAPVETRLNSLELAALTQPPDEEFLGVRIQPRVPFAANPPCPRGAARLALGRVVVDGTPSPAWYEVDLADLSRHVLIAGLTGSGKTQTTQFLLSQLWGEHRIPWLVVEPSPKCEYRALLGTTWGGDLRVYTPGNEAIAPLRLNPLEVPEGVHVQQHIDATLAVLRAGFALVTPMPEVLSAALHACYQRHGWDLARGSRAATATGAPFPTLSELADFLGKYIPTLGYGAEITGNLRAGLEMRLRNLVAGGRGLLFDAPRSTPSRELLARPTVLELAALGDNDTKALFMGLLLLRLSQGWSAAARGNGALRHVMVIEEAHRLLRAAPRSTNHEIADPRGHAVELFSDLMDEARRFGTGIVLVDQSPSRIDAAALRATNLKLIHRLLAAEDRDAVARAINLRPDQAGHLADLSPGEAVAHSEGAHGAVWLRVPNHAPRHGYAGQAPDDPAVARQMAHRATTSPVSDTPEGCVACGGVCAHHGAATRYLTAHNRAEEFGRAFDAGYEAVWRTALACADGARVPRLSRGAFAFCAANQVARATGARGPALARFARRMRALREEHDGAIQP